MAVESIRGSYHDERRTEVVRSISPLADTTRCPETCYSVFATTTIVDGRGLLPAISACDGRHFVSALQQFFRSELFATSAIALAATATELRLPRLASRCEKFAPIRDRRANLD